MYITHSITLIMSIRCYGQPFICGQLWIIFMHGQPLHILSLHSLIFMHGHSVQICLFLSVCILCFANNTNKEPYEIVKKYNPSGGHKTYKYPPRVVIRSLLKQLNDLGLVQLSNVQDPATNSQVKWWAADVQFVRVQHAWNNGTEQQRKALHRLFVRESALNGGHIDWARYVGDFREPQSVNQVLRAEWNDYTVQI
eukprot:929724_1